jgi:hypothetical protein
MSIYLLNISVDTTNLSLYENSPKGVEINEQDSIVEIILEQVLDLEDFVKEIDCEDCDVFMLKMKLAKNVFVCYDLSDSMIFFVNSTKKDFFFNQDIFRKISLRKIIPPPKY